MHGRTVLVTGATDGIGKATALQLARLGAHVIVHGRNAARTTRAANELTKEAGAGAASELVADLSSLHEVRKAAATLLDRYPAIHVLLHNAGVYMPERVLTVDGYETTFAVNHLAPQLLTGLLLDRVKASGRARIVTVSSMVHVRARLDLANLQGEREYDGYRAYGLSKLANVLFTWELAERLRGTDVTATCLHPGVIATKLLATGFPGSIGASLDSGAATSVYLASSPDVEGVSGAYFADKKRSVPSPLAEDAEVRRTLWDVSEKLVGGSDA
jgi:NAD(P)-dependent dehydrogenase (short-subunit alcohol dehydrogenase family)